MRANSVQQALQQHLMHVAMILLMALVMLGVADASGLTLAQAEQMALANAPLVEKANAQYAALKNQAIAAYAWPDPMIRLGVVNLSTDTYDMADEAMTQRLIGISQSLPPRGSTTAKREQMLEMASAAEEDVSHQRLLTLKNLRLAWLDLYNASEAYKLITESHKVFDQLKNITRLQYRSGRGSQQDVVRAQLEESLLIDNQQALAEQRDNAFAEVQRWVGVSNLGQSLDPDFPALLEPMPLTQLLMRLETHPFASAARAQIKAAEQGVEFADTQYNSSWTVDMSYGTREAERTNLVSAVIAVQVPLFSSRKQGKLYQAATADRTAAQRELDDRLRQLQQRLSQAYNQFERSEQRLKLFESDLLKQAEQNAQAAVTAYQSGVTDFNSVIRARLTELNSQLQYLNLRVKKAKSQAELAYLAGG